MTTILIDMKKQLLFAAFLAATAAHAQVRLQPMFSDNMVLQQQTQAPIWGEAMPGKTVRVTTSWNQQTYEAKADASGRWSVRVATPAAGGPYDIVVSDGTPVTLRGVLIGEVWLCSGQSNMEMPLDGWGKVKDYQQEIAGAQAHPNIRLLRIKQTTNTQPATDIAAAGDGWEVCSSATIPEFSATAYFFGRDIEKYRGVPVGLIETCWGGTLAEAWTSREALSTMPDFTAEVARVSHLPSDLDERNALYVDELMQWDQYIQQHDPGFTAGKPAWAATAYDDRAWATVSLPGKVDGQGFGSHDGVIWYRKTFDIPREWAGKDLTLYLGNVDDCDITYFNGTLIGHTEGFGANRQYTIPAALVKKGKACLTVRSLDTGGEAGLLGWPDGDITIACEGRQPLSLAGSDWRAKATLSLGDVPPLPRNTANDPNVPTVLFNAMLNPLIPYAIKGAIWYQGEANELRAYQYRDLLPLMITDWRTRWGSDFPFYIAQLANFRTLQTEPCESAWAEVREAQTRTLHLAGTGMACLIDIGDANDIHPKNKQEVGRRLALAARAQTYGEDIEYSGPMMSGYQLMDGAIRIDFTHAESGLCTPDGSDLRGFAIAGVDHRFHWAEARVDGRSVVVSSPEVPFPVAVRYAWADNPVCNLYNGEGLPANPFRTDDWPGVTFGNK